jgi:hypothetical protein
MQREIRTCGGGRKKRKEDFECERDTNTKKVSANLLATVDLALLFDCDATSALCVCIMTLDALESSLRLESEHLLWVPRCLPR